MRSVTIAPGDLCEKFQVRQKNPQRIPLDCSFSSSLVFLHRFCSGGLVLELCPAFLSASTLAFQFAALGKSSRTPVLSAAPRGESRGLMELDAGVRYLAGRR